MVHLYALVEHPARLPSLAGIAGAAVSAAEAAGIDAVFSRHDGAADEATDDAILAHARLVEAVASLNPAVLPARFPGRYEDEAALLEAVRGRAPVLREAIDRVRGCTELGVRVIARNLANETPGSGSEYMRARLDAVREAEQVASELDGAVRSTIRDRARSIGATPQLVVSTAYLVPEREVDAFRAAADGVARGRPDLEYVIVGPWPPYSFALVDRPSP